MSSGAGAQTPFLAGGGELGERIRSFDWASTSLGPADGWPESLRIAVRIMLASRQPIWIGWGDDLVYLYNDPYKAIIGGKHPHMLGQPTRVVWAEIWDVIGPMLDTALTGEEGTYVESQLLIMERHGYREETYYTFSYSPIPGDDGRAFGIICANTDDTQRVIGERQLATLRELGAKTAEALTREAVAACAAEALGINPRDLPFALVYLLDEEGEGFTLAGATGMEPGSDSELATRLRLVLGGRDPLVVEDLETLADAPFPSGAWDEPPTAVAYVPLAGDGVLVVGLNPFRRFDDAYSDFLGLVGAQISASIATARAYEQERQRAEALAEIDRAKTVFFSNVSHEFRTPLTLMLGPLDDLVGAADGLPPEAREKVEVARRNALRLLRMVNTVLDFSRVGTGQSSNVFRPTDLARFTDEIAERFAPLLDRSGLRFVTDLQPLPDRVYVDGEAWDTIVLNLLSNAFKFTLHGEIRVSLDAADGSARLRVADTGTGIPAAELPHLFERFHRVRNEQARTYEGTGIGLALVRELVELHGGTVSVESTLGEGTTFTVSIPFGTAHLQAAQVSGDEAPARSTDAALAYTEEAGRWAGIEADAALGDETAQPASDTRVVVVDDNADMRDYMTRLLERHWRVETHPDGEAALAAIRNDPPALVVTDVMMPRLDGFGLLGALRSDPATAPIPVIVVSARAGEESSVEGMERGADDYLVKPFSALELVARVRANLELARLRAEAGRLAALEDIRARVITTASHELRTPVTAIYGASRTLERSNLLDEQTRSALLSVIASESERLANITSDFLTTESLATGLVSMRPERFDLRPLVEDAVRAAEASAPPTFRFETQLPDEPVTLHADPVRLQQVVANILDNAVKYSPEGGTVETVTELAGGEVRVTITDQGIGVPEQHRSEIFHRFYRVDPGLTGGVGGSGLGLYICRQLVESMGGRIALEQAAGTGSRFVVSLPQA